MRKFVAFLLLFSIIARTGFCVALEIEKPRFITGRIVKIDSEIHKFYLRSKGSEYGIYYSERTLGHDFVEVGNDVYVRLSYVRGNIPVAREISIAEGEVILDADDPITEQQENMPAEEVAENDTMSVDYDMREEDPASQHAPLIIYN